jgi:hypothetical protein
MNKVTKINIYHIRSMILKEHIKNIWQTHECLNDEFHCRILLKQWVFNNYFQAIDFKIFLSKCIKSRVNVTIATFINYS